jgi:murein DD-endopeptidase MepM/ murein hydrolase activator NlpD
MTHPRSQTLASVAPLLLVVALLSACFGGSSASSKPAPAGDGDGDGGIVIATLTPAAEASQPSPTPSASTAPATPTPEPEAPTPQPPSAVLTGLSLQPPQLRQGGYSVVYLHEAAANATLSFGGLQYPMLPDGDRWWAVIGIGAFAEPGLAPLSVAYTPADGGDVVSIAQSIEIVDHEYPVENINLDPETSALLDPEILNNELAVRAGVLSGYTAAKLWSGPFSRPAEGPLSSIYGVARSYNNGPVSGYHHGTDFAGDIGDPIYAAAGGVVVFAQELRVRGNTIMIDHGAGLFTAYNHLSAFNVTEGETVTAGQLIGALGSTGLVTGPHLHWEVVVRSVEVDGELWLEGNSVGP